MYPWQQPSVRLLLFTLLALLTAQCTISVIMRFSHPPPALLAALTSFMPTKAQSTPLQCGPSNQSIDLSWHAPSQNPINNLTNAINGTGTNGFIFNSSLSPPHTGYNYCNMPHVHPSTYTPAPSEYKLEYVELIHRHHKRTPYASNTFPREAYSWDCSDEGLFYGGKPINPSGNGSADTYWSVYTSPSNPFPPEGFNGTCQFPQITRGGLDDSHQHGADLRAVYADLLSFLPADYDPAVTEFRVTNNVITSQVGSMLIASLYPSLANTDVPLKIQPESIDSLEPTYSCPHADALYASYGPGSNASAWRAHLDAAAGLKARLDAVSGIDPRDEEWSQSYDHYFDSLSSRLCHAKPLPCNPNTTTSGEGECITTSEADQVLRLGEYEYSFIYRDAPLSLAASTASFGVWTVELADHFRSAISGRGKKSGVKYRHNIAHDGSVSRLLSILQIEQMVWPGMGAEVVFELYSSSSSKEENGRCYFVRVLWSGEPLVSSHPDLGEMDMVPVETVLGYFDGLAGVGAEKVPGLCRAAGSVM